MNKMDRRKLRPTVKITTYSEGKSFRFLGGNKGAQQQQQGQHREPEEATRSYDSTDFFASKHSAQARARLLMDLSQIKGPTGSIRGHKDVVRKSLEGIRVACNRRLESNSALAGLSTFSQSPALSSLSTLPTSFSAGLPGRWSNLQQIDEQYCSDYLLRLQEEEHNSCVAYTTTLGVIRRTFEDSKQMRSILRLNLIKFQERDIYLNQEFKLQLRLRCNSISVPALFVDGRYLGGAKELEQMNENGELSRVLSKFKLSAPPKGTCLCCGDAKFIACLSCNGSRKSTIHHFKFNSIALRCIKCDKNDGLVQCPACQLSDGGPMELSAGDSCEDHSTRLGAPNSWAEQLAVDENNNNNSQDLETIKGRDGEMELLGERLEREVSTC